MHKFQWIIGKMDATIDGIVFVGNGKKNNITYK